jgi:uncharacterized protein YdeI (YjbR/CyaY-like superfamily)
MLAGAPTQQWRPALAGPGTIWADMRDRRSEFPILAFESADELRAWLESHHAESPGMWLRIFKKNSGVPSVSFEDVLDEGLCFGWSESSKALPR